jgi:hypothetical protein
MALRLIALLALLLSCFGLALSAQAGPVILPQAGCGISISGATVSAAGQATNGDSNFAIPSTASLVSTATALTAPRTWMLPTASSLAAGCTVTVSDSVGGVTSTNTLTVTRAGTDTISGATSVVLQAAFASATFKDTGSSWTIVGDELTVATACPSNQFAIASNASGKLLTCAQPTYANLGGTPPSVVDVQQFTASGTWTNPAGCASPVVCHTVISAIGGGGGGGGGAREALGTVGSGGAGGGGGQCIPAMEFLTASLPSTVTVTVGAGGTAGPGATSAGPGTAGGLGTDTLFGSILTAFAGGGGAGGQTAAASGGGSGAFMNADGLSGSGSTPGGSNGNGGSPGVAAGQGNGNNSGSYAASGGGASTSAAFAGGAGQCAGAGGSGGTLLASSATTGGRGGGNTFGFSSAGGATAGGAGQPSIPAPTGMLSMNGGQTGSGGGANTAGPGGAGGACAPGTYGAGGSGGGAGTTAGGAGGPGCPGYLIAITTGAP